MIALRFAASGTGRTIFVPGTIFIGPCSQVSSVWRSHVMPEPFSAGLKA